MCKIALGKYPDTNYSRRHYYFHIMYIQLLTPNETWCAHWLVDKTDMHVQYNVIIITQLNNTEVKDVVVATCGRRKETGV